MSACLICKFFKDEGYILICLAQYLEFWDVLANDSTCELQEVP